MLLALACLAQSAEITVYTYTPAYVTVDGVFLDYSEGSLLLTARNLSAGKHVVKVESLQRKSITQMDVTIRQDERIDLGYGQRTLQRVGNGLVGEAPNVPGLSASVGAGPNGVVVAMGSPSSAWPAQTLVVMPGFDLGISTPGAPVPPSPPEPPKPVAVQVVFSLKDNFDLSNVYVDGKRVAEMRTGDREKVVTLMTGTHTVEIKEFTEFETWFKGTLVVSEGEPMRVGYGEDEGVEVYNRVGAWSPR
jgi:hypothetical protein